MGEVFFEKISAYKHADFPLPQRSTAHSAGYDFVLPNDVVVLSIYKQIFKMVRGRMKSPEFDMAFADTDLSSNLAYEGNDILANGTEEEKVNYAVNLLSFLPEAKVLFQEVFTMELSEVKDLVKEVGARATLAPTGVKVKLKDNQKLELMVRSSTPFNSYIILGNGIGLIDADYYNNEDNEGHIFFQLINLSPFDIKLKKGDIIGQGVISTYDKVDNDEADAVREGGIGSTSENK